MGTNKTIELTSNPMRKRGEAKAASSEPEKRSTAMVPLLWQEAIDTSTYFFTGFVEAVTHHDVSSAVPRAAWISAGLVFNVGVAIFWGFLLTRGVKEVRNSRFLSLEGGSWAEVCSPVRRQLADTYRLDDSGAWSTSSSYIFRSSMVVAKYRDFQFDDKEYGVFMGKTSQLLRRWNADLAALPVDRALTYAVASLDGVDGKNLYVWLDVSPESVLAVPFLEAYLVDGDDAVEFTVTKSRGTSVTIEADLEDVWALSEPLVEVLAGASSSGANADDMLVVECK